MTEGRPFAPEAGRAGNAGSPSSASFTNSYCTNCLRTRRFHDRVTHLVCETCSKHLHRVVPARRSAG